MTFRLHSNLLLGVATSATQIEGGDTNNTWYNWTKNHDKTRDGSDTLLANSHWENYKEHIDLMKEFNFQIYRMSIEWSRIEIDEDVFSIENMNHYIDEINYLKSKGIKVLVTLHHFSNPIWFDNKGGFKNRKFCVQRFTKYAEFVAKNLNGIVDEFCTINEPNTYTVLTYLVGEWVQQEKSWKTAKTVYKNLALCHIEAYKMIHKIIPNSKVGFALNVTRFIPLRKNNIFDRYGTFYRDRQFNLAVFEAFAFGKLIFPLGCSKKKGVFYDYTGINYYTTHVTKGKEELFPETGEFNDLGWVITPEGFREVLIKYYKKYKKEIYVTENGTADKKDAIRPQFIYSHLKAICDLEFVTRYYHWSFMDNFEWKDGYGPCFGLVEYHYVDATYTPRPSAYLYRDIISNKGVTFEMMSKYDLKDVNFE